jgi:hypothetical protein
VTLPDISTPDGRRAWAFLAITGGTMAMTLFALFGVYQLRNIPDFTFWLAMAAHAQVFLGMGALGWAMGRRMQNKLTRGGIETDDRSGG